MVLYAKLDREPQARANPLYKHRFLTDKQYMFCLNYAFGLCANIGAYTGAKFGTDTDELLKAIISQAVPEYRKTDNILKYAFDNAAGSYKAAYNPKNYDSAKTNGIRLLKDPYIRLELSFMYSWINNTKGFSRMDGHRQYKSPFILWNDEKEQRLQTYIKKNGNVVSITIN